jgi:DNA-binding SARP family transcriptional activator
MGQSFPCGGYKTVTPSLDRVDFRILGPLEVVDGERSVLLRGSRQRALLALLLLSPNQVVSLARMADELWADEPPGGVVHTLRVYVSRLRSALGPGGDQVVVTRPPG